VTLISSRALAPPRVHSRGELSRSAAGGGAGLLGFHRHGFSSALGPGRGRHDLPIPTPSARGASWSRLALGASAFTGGFGRPTSQTGVPPPRWPLETRGIGHRFPACTFAPIGRVVAPGQWGAGPPGFAVPTGAPLPRWPGQHSRSYTN